MASVCTVREALIKSTRTGSERFCLQTRYGKCGNTVCISHSSYRRLGAKDPLSSRRRFIQRFLRLYQASASPRLRQALRASSSGVSWQITLSQAKFAPFSRQLSSQVRIHSPSPQP